MGALPPGSISIATPRNAVGAELDANFKMTGKPTLLTSDLFDGRFRQARRRFKDKIAIARSQQLSYYLYFH